MIQHRTFELLKNPQSIQAEDLRILEKDIAMYPYMQSIRAVYLYGNHLYNPDAYKELLSLTAAYTTDKKNLYQLIKQEEILQEEVAVVAEETNQLPIANSQTSITDSQDKINILEKSDTSKEVLEEEKILHNEDLTENKEVSVKEETIQKEELTTSIEEPKTSINFDNNSEDLLPKVKFEPVKTESYQTTVKNEKPSTSLNKHEEEMKRLIAEVEAKMAKNKATKKQQISQEEIINTDINFNEYERENDEIKTENREEETPKQEQNSNWKPLNFQPNLPDALLKKEESRKEISSELKISEVQKQELPLEEKTAPTEQIPSESPQSNVPKFINTWQSWLKLDLAASSQLAENTDIQMSVNEDEKEKEQKTNAPTEDKNQPIPQKSQVIDVFIENNPKISKINKDFSETYTLKDKGDDISHLMTETLANLYVEQRLYAKAIKAFKILTQKYPEKKEHFKARIQEVKELRANKNFNE